MQRFIDSYPQYKLLSGTVGKHVSLMGKISEIVNKRKLLSLSAAEQEIVCGNEHEEAYGKINKILEDSDITFMDKLKCTMLYMLRYESGGINAQNGGVDFLGPLLGNLRASARISGYNESIVDDSLEKLLAYSTSTSPGGCAWPLFPGDIDPMSLRSVVKSIQTNVKGVDNIYTQHKSSMVNIVNTLLNGELKTAQFPFAEGGNTRT